MSMILSAAIVDQTAYLQSAFDAAYASFNSNTISPTSSTEPAPLESHVQPSGKRKDPPRASSNKPHKKVRRVGPRTSVRAVVMGGNGDKDAEAGSGKPKRVRTGCLTCRERHLKCDEGLPVCHNCKKSNRTCKRGIRLNFIDLWNESPPHMVSAYGTDQWRVEFMDESREIASEYEGGVQKYRPLDLDEPLIMDPNMPMLSFDLATSALPAPPGLLQEPLPPVQSLLPDTYIETTQQSHTNGMYQTLPQQAQIQAQTQTYTLPPNPDSGSILGTQFSSSGPSSVVGHASVSSYTTAHQDTPSDNSRKEFLNTQEETLFMQVFVEEVGLWMDSMDSQKHFSRLLPFHSLSEPMLVNAFLACGAKHLTLVNPAYTEEKALHYYDTATTHLLQNLQNPNRDTVICATTAVILNVYEIMSERALQRMNHIAGARALIKECGWNARAQGIGSACFWLNVGLEVLSCLHFNWQVAWDPDDWQVDMDFTREIMNGREEVWTHRMLYILAKICNFRATIPRHPEQNLQDDQIRTQQRYEEWSRLKGWADAWNDGIPRTMQPMAFLYSHQTSSKSLFPEVWLVKRSAIVGRLFFHTAQLLLAQTHPYYGTENGEMAELAKRHSNMICGIVAHVKDRGVASVALRSLAHASDILTDRQEQEEVLGIFDRINKETGWRIGFVYEELKKKWGWVEGPSPQQVAQTHKAATQQKRLEQEQHDQQQQRQMQEQVNAAHQMQAQLKQQDFHVAQQQQQPQQNPLQPLPPPQQQPTPQAPKKPPTGIPNPLYAKADFNLPQHPYMNHYVAPNPFHTSAHGGGGMFYSY
ncbi:hypothetical protein LTR62_005977 [Meristemomyces frigidus]|uniref:Zn(2)-C6 fungal-type domain-containing protein n=1 Tax=Meristemomyces frigidus TaxID=1508187 RepID=A0AAN7TIT3_9PEZI|nr:hypothetical protein LTR62_005977 [Meristemomyces frigidus]